MIPWRLVRRRRRLASACSSAPELPGKRHARWAGITGFACWASASALLWGLGSAFLPLLAEGQRAATTLVAAVDFTCPDLAATEWMRRQATESAPPIFTVGLARRNEILRDLGKLFEQVGRIRLRRPGGVAQTEEDLTSVADLLGLSLSATDLQVLVPEDHAEEALEALRGIFRVIWGEAIVLPWDREERLKSVAPGGRIILLDPESGEERSVALHSLRTPAEAVEAAVRAAQSEPVLVGVPEDTLRRLWSPWMTPNLVYEPVLSRQRREEAVRRVPEARMKVTAGTVIIEAGDRATGQTVILLREHNRRLREKISPHERWRILFARSGLLLLSLMLALGLLRRFEPEVFEDRKVPLMILGLSLLTLGAIRLVMHVAAAHMRVGSVVWESALPPGLAPIVAVVLSGGGVAVAMGFWLAAAASIFLNFSFQVLLSGSLATAAVVLAARRIRSRGAIFRLGLAAAAAGVAIALLTALVSPPAPALLVRQCAFAAASGLLSSAVALLLIPLLEMTLGFTSDIRLLELSDPGHPLLQRLAAEAPGTYHHSLMVAQLAQAAADEIGANALLVRVCAYYHDIGKLLQPAYYAENMPSGLNPHDRLTPRLSTMVILSHVKDGLTLARQYWLPAPILDAIREHHGSGMVSFFHQKAARAAGAQPPPPEAEFRYPGPPPRTREMAILSLADAVEAASRSLREVSPARIQRLVDEVAERKRQDGQLDHCNMTFDELRRVKRALVFALTTMLHRRIPYPHSHEDHPAQSAAMDDRSAVDMAPTGPAPHAEDAGAESGTNLARTDDPAAR